MAWTTVSGTVHVSAARIAVRSAMADSSERSTPTINGPGSHAL